MTPFGLHPTSRGTHRRSREIATRAGAHARNRVAYLVAAVIVAVALVGTGCLALRAPHLPQVSTAAASGAVARSDAAERTRVRFTQLPLAFEANVGQAPDEVRYVSQGPGMRLELTSNGARFTPSDGGHERRAIRLRLVGGAAPALSAEEELPGKAHHITGNNPAAWHRDVPTYRRVVYRGVYAGTDLVFHGTHGAAEFDFVVAPGADPRAIRVEIAGADALTLDGDDVSIRAGAHALRLHAPVVYQDFPQGRVRVDGRFRLDGHQIAFELGAYDRDRALVIDPIVTYATYLSAGGWDVDVDAAGNIYVTTGGALLKLNASGSTLLWSATFGDMRVGELVVDAAGNAYMQGSCPYNRSGAVYICPTLGPLTTGRPQAQGDVGAYVLKVSPGGSLLFSTSMGGTGTVTPSGIAVDVAGNIYAAAWDVYGGFPLTRPAYASPGAGGTFLTVVEAIAADLSRFLYVVQFQTGSLRPSGLAVDRAGAAYVTGVAEPGFPTTAGVFQPSAPGLAGVVAKIGAGGALAYATYFGNASTSPRAIAVDAGGDAYIAGAAGAGLPTLRALQPALAGGTDAFVARLNAAGSALVFSTYLGGSGDDVATTIGLDDSDNVYVAGTTRSINFPQRNALPAPFGSAASNFVAELNSDASTLVYSTYFADAQTAVTGLSVTGTGTVYLTGTTSSTSLPTVRPYQAAPGGGFVAALEPSAVRVFITTPADGATVSGSVWSDVWAENYVGASNTFTLSIGDTVLATGTATNHATLAWDSRGVSDGSHILTATVRDSGGHVGTATRAVTIRNGTTLALTPVFTSPAAGATVSGTVSVGMTVTGASVTPITFTLAVDGAQVFTATGTATAATFPWSTAPPGGPALSGTHVLALTVRDGAGRTATARRSVTVANGGGGGAPPSSPGTLKVFITSPAVGATVSGPVWSDVWVEGAAAGTRTFTLAIGGVTLASAADASNHVTVRWDSARVASGTQTLVATVRDAAGNSGSAARAFNVQNSGGGGGAQPPPPPPPPAGPINVVITQPRSGEAARGIVWFTIWVERAAAGAKTYTLSEGGRTLATTTTTSSGPVSILWTTTPADNGPRAPAIGVRDATGATGAASLNLTVAN